MNSDKEIAAPSDKRTLLDQTNIKAVMERNMYYGSNAKTNVTLKNQIKPLMYQPFLLGIPNGGKQCKVTYALQEDNADESIKFE